MAIPNEDIWEKMKKVANHKRKYGQPVTLGYSQNTITVTIYGITQKYELTDDFKKSFISIYNDWESGKFDRTHS